MRKIGRRMAALALMGLVTALVMTGCGETVDGKRIVRISPGQLEAHPQYIGLVASKDYMEERLGDKFEVQIFPNEIFGSVQKATELTQTGAIGFVVASTANLETFTGVYEVLSMPYLFDSRKSYLEAMQDADYMEQIYEFTDEVDFRVLIWCDTGTRNFYMKKSIRTSGDLEGLEIRVQQSSASMKMMQAFGATVSPMSSDEMYTAIQQGAIDGVENNELALVNNKHGRVAKYFTYSMHQTVPDMLVGNLKFSDSLSPEELQIFKEVATLSTEAELGEQDKQVEEAKAIVRSEMGVKFIEVDVAPFKEKVLLLRREMLRNNLAIMDVYDYIQAIDQRVKEER